MHLQTDPIASPAAPSATVVMLRDGAAGLEVFLLRRHGLSDVLGGAYVFPGGKVDREDAEWLDRLDEPAESLHRRLGEAELTVDDAAALYVAAVREAFEETGALFADASPEAAAESWQRLREGPRFGELFEGLGLTLGASRLVPWSRWITPIVGGVVRKRFDTRFFVAATPPGQQPGHDDHEATASLWLRPRDALQQYWDGGIELAPPQIMSLAHLARHADVHSVLASAAAIPPPCVRPEAVDAGPGRVLCYPGDPAHSVAARALPGPTRLHWRNDRFEPEGGLEALLGD